MKKKQIKFKKNDVVMLINPPRGPRRYWQLDHPEFHATLGLVVRQVHTNRVEVKHYDCGEGIFCFYDEHPSELVKIGVL